MSAHPHDAPHAGARSTAESVGEAFEALSSAAPEGWRVELIEGDIQVRPPGTGAHARVVGLLVEQMVEHRTNKGWSTRTGLGLLLPGTDPDGRVAPDLVVAPRGIYGNKLEYQDPAEVVMVGEVTAPSTVTNDRLAKRRGYARAGIPFYLLVDREAGTVSLYSEPSGEHYTRDVTVTISKTITLPDPLGFDLDTSEF
ncbi:hypothetical protein SRB5_32140 [Streptomyces sp. RB5]|uniref:Putative restriction endonuclease domain-containing protein n=1 Tax=Streptomyces smaragdinus TaxID=2585196 RepID=A0A7K0CJY3_9ACTN|nr:Uma2 family endonuclease [Streptomyces smaragdinus]MQY13074.1 hypothetical protein [Streptomyces smaragdinus]